MPQFIGSSAPLPAGQTYTSRWVLADMFEAITGSCLTDQVGTLFVEQSGDGTVADTSTSVAITANTGASYNVPIVLPFVRLRMNNSAASAQTSLRLFSRFTLGNMP